MINEWLIEWSPLISALGVSILNLAITFVKTSQKSLKRKVKIESLLNDDTIMVCLPNGEKISISEVTFERSNKNEK